ncbi:MAG: caspase family protein [Candidatus Methylomirabilia bacterium]
MRAVRGILILLAGLGLLADATCAVAKGPRAERPTYSVGEQWIRNDGLYELVRIEDDRYVFVAGPGREIHLTKDLALAKIRRGKLLMEFDPPPELTWPLEVGKWGTSSGLWQHPRSPAGVPVTFTWSVEAHEEVHVAAGTFQAFRISLSIEHGRSRRRWELVTWYAPEARQLVKAESDLRFLAFQAVAVDQPAPAPLEVALETPKDQARVTKGRVVVRGKVTAGKGVARVAVTVNGQEVVTQDEGGAPKGEVALNVPIRLREGKNVVIVTARDAGGDTRQEGRSVYYDKPKPPVAAVPKPARPSSTPPAVPAPRAVPQPLQVTISSPQNQVRVDHESIALAGVSSGGTGVSRVVITLNGVEVSRLEKPTPQPSLAVNVPIQLREGSNTLVVTATGADGMTVQEVRSIHYEKRVPLTVAFRYPEDGSRATAEESLVAAVITSSKGVAKVSVTLNGTEVFQQSPPTPQRSVAVTVSVTLREGANAIVVSASEPDGMVQQELRTVIYERPRVAVAEPARAIQIERWAVVIGIGRYQSRQISRLRYTVQDAEAIYKVLINQAGFKKENILLLTDKTERPPTLRNIKWALGSFLARSAKKDDIVIIFFAGHGAPEPDPRGIESDGLAKYLIPIDADPEDLYSTALPMDEFQTIFGRLEAERVVVFLDSCYSGAAGGRTFASRRTRALNVDDLFLERLTRSKGRAIITASRPAEVSIELPELGHGVFTYYLIQGLKGVADLDHDGIVSLHELYQYIEQEVTRKSRAAGGNQHPIMKGELEGVLPLVKVSRR